NRYKLREKGDGVGRRVLEFERHQVAFVGQHAQMRVIRIIRAQVLAELRRAGVGCRIEKYELHAERVASERQHAPELSTADDAYLHDSSRGSGLASTLRVCSARNAFSAVAYCGYLLPRILAASSAALMAPALPIASVATGTPAGICTIDSSESTPLSIDDCTGTPSTGRWVLAAHMPGRCAAPPAPAMMTSIPRCSACSAYSNSRSGVRCADTTLISWAMPS